MRWEIWRWFTPEWWRYLAEGSTGWRNIWCRIRGHPCGPRYFTMSGSEPDWRCQNCDENLG